MLVKLYSYFKVGGDNGDNESGSESSGGMGNIPLILLVITSGIAIYCLTKHNNDKNKIVDRLHYGKLAKKIPKGTILPSKYNGGYEYSFDFWLYVSDLNYKYNLEKVIFNWKDNIKVSIKKKTPSLLVEVFTINGNPELLEYNDLPIQRWLYITIVVKNRYLDILINGELYSTKLLQRIPVYEITSLNLCPNGGFSGYINKFRYSPHSIDIDTIKKTLSYGPNNSTLLDVFSPTKTPKCSK